MSSSTKIFSRISIRTTTPSWTKASSLIKLHCVSVTLTRMAPYPKKNTQRFLYNNTTTSTTIAMVMFPYRSGIAPASSLRRPTDSIYCFCIYTQRPSRAGGLHGTSTTVTLLSNVTRAFFDFLVRAAQLHAGNRHPQTVRRVQRE